MKKAFTVMEVMIVVTIICGLIALTALVFHARSVNTHVLNSSAPSSTNSVKVIGYIDNGESQKLIAKATQKVAEAEALVRLDTGSAKSKITKDTEEKVVDLLKEANALLARAEKYQTTTTLERVAP